MKTLVNVDEKTNQEINKLLKSEIFATRFPNIFAWTIHICRTRQTLPKGCISTGLYTHQERQICVNLSWCWICLFFYPGDFKTIPYCGFLTDPSRFKYRGIQYSAGSQSLQAKEDSANLRSPKIWTIFWKISEPLILPLQECNIPSSKLTVRPCQSSGLEDQFPL